MQSKFVGAGLVLALVGLFAPACGGDDPPITSGESDAGTDVVTAFDAAGGDATSVAGECVVNDDCTARLPVTTPPGCAVATCDTLQKKCHFKSKDADGDGHTAKACTAATATIETGDDCDDSDDKSYPGAWDGPSTSSDGGAGEPDRCDQKDNDCNGSPDDGKIAVDGGSKTCKCDPSAPLPCYEYPNGAPIAATTLDATNNPKGACKKGTRTCPNGVPGTCVGAVGPDPAGEQCDNVDHDCDGVSGNAGDTVATAPIWYKDSDGDNFGDMATTPKQQCVSPAGLWKLFIPNTDCDDNDGGNTPGKAEICDGKDNNCNGTVDEGVQTNFCADTDTDGYCTAACTLTCVAPAGYRPQNTCSAGVDCNDGDLNVHPTAYEYCGDGVDSNCTGGDSETFPNLNQACTAGTFGVCRHNGSYVCTAAKTSTTCNATAGTAGSGASVPSNDPAIDMSQARSGYDPRWDYNCDNNQTIGESIYGGTFRQYACSGSYAAACASLTTQALCNAGVFGAKFFNCEYYPANSFYFTDPTSPTQMCGRNVNYISCLWQFNGGSGCDYLANTYTANNHAVSCN